ncbi:hypothetical protein CCM_03566 [Cordyceps militaris CM01]|uniref:Uncharacterized protein n=1 Tax=Cordyceps militaris (strain CM01) TaxID=983644 RepID=G3JBI9_CORMM|nr:uncharacterized protein CCM_03566 [Cordyceps militaris CM01]EGX95294.1 hypothetical protein CCM_03566 [Cordyceps militaris CM01]
MKSLNLIILALASIGSARSAAVRQEDVTPEKVCDWFETGRHNSPTKPDQNCRSNAQKCIGDQVKKSNVSDQVTKDDITLCTFTPIIVNLLREQDTTDFMTVCDSLDVARETCHSNTAWCVMDYATFTKSIVDKTTALAEVQSCVAGRILNEDGDDTAIKCNSTRADADLGRTICSEDYFGEDPDKWDEERELVNKCKEEFDRKTPKSDILKLTQLGQYCQDQGVECSKCRMYLLDEDKGDKSFLGSYIVRIDRVCPDKPQINNGANRFHLERHRVPGWSSNVVFDRIQRGLNIVTAPESTPKTARRCTGQVKVDATTKEFFELVDRMQQVKP